MSLLSEGFGRFGQKKKSQEVVYEVAIKDKQRGWLGAAAGTVQGPVKVVGAVGLLALNPTLAGILGVGALLSRGKVLGRDLPVPIPTPVLTALQPLQQFQKIAAVLALTRIGLPVLSPANWRTICYFRRMLPILRDYQMTKKKSKRCTTPEEREALWQKQHEKGAKAVYAMLEEFGGFNLKLAQILAVKAEYLPPEYPLHLSGIFCSLSPMPSKQVRSIIKKSWKCDLEDKLLHFEDDPIASATIAQVHRGYTKEGMSVALKVQRQNAKKVIGADIRNLTMMVELMAFLKVDLGFDMLTLVREYGEVVPAEFDFSIELKNLEGMRESLLVDTPSFNPDPYLVTYPEPVSDLCSSQVLALEFVEGQPLIQDSNPTIPQDQARNLMMALLHDYGRQIFLDGKFHTDPHPGNLFVNHKGRLVLLDMGQVKTLSDDDVLDLADMVLALVTRDEDTIIQQLDATGVKFRKCTQEIEMVMAYIFFDTYLGHPMLRVKPGDPGAEWMGTTVLKALPRQYFMLLRVMTLLRGVLATYQLDISAAEIWAPYARLALGKEPGNIKLSSPTGILQTLERTRVNSVDSRSSLDMTFMRTPTDGFGYSNSKGAIETPTRELSFSPSPLKHTTNNTTATSDFFKSSKESKSSSESNVEMQIRLSGESEVVGRPLFTPEESAAMNKLSGLNPQKEEKEKDAAIRAYVAEAMGMSAAQLSAPKQVGTPTRFANGNGLSDGDYFPAAPHSTPQQPDRSPRSSYGNSRVSKELCLTPKLIRKYSDLPDN